MLAFEQAVAFDRPVSGVSAALNVGLPGTWSPVSEAAPGYATVWTFAGAADGSVTISPGEGEVVDQRGNAVAAVELLSSALPRSLCEEGAAECLASKEVVEGQLGVLEELLEVEESSKWALYTQTQLLLELAGLEEDEGAAAAEVARQARQTRLEGEGSLSGALGPRREQVLRNLSSLAELDPAHKQQFSDMRSANAIEGLGSAAMADWRGAAELAGVDGGGL